MNIEEIEKNLNNYEVNPDRAIACLLNATAHNQAMIEALIDLQLTILAQGDKEAFNELSKAITETTQKKLAVIQAKISSQFR